MTPEYGERLRDTLGPPRWGHATASSPRSLVWTAELWRLRKPGTLVVEPFHRLRGADVTEEGLRLLAFLTPDAHRHEVMWAGP